MLSIKGSAPSSGEGCSFYVQETFEKLRLTEFLIMSE